LTALLAAVLAGAFLAAAFLAGAEPSAGTLLPLLGRELTVAAFVALGLAGVLAVVAVTREAVAATARLADGSCGTSIVTPASSRARSTGRILAIGTAASSQAILTAEASTAPRTAPRRRSSWSAG
jgi:hypothetical protein